MIAIIYSGSRYANWKLAFKGEVVADFKTAGINPFFNDEKFISNLLNKNIKLIHFAEKIKKIYFFGAGASSNERNKVIENAFSKFFKFSRVSINHDMLAAAKASCGEKEGIACIIGSGSNAAYYNGKKIVENNYGLGYVLGDEGSANWLGRKFLKASLNKKLPINLQQLFTKRYDLDRKQILEKIYKSPHPNIFLSSFSDFFIENRNDSYIKNMIIEGFNLFFDNYLKPLLNLYGNQIPVYVVGTVAANFQDYLREAASENNINNVSVIKEPIYNLLNYYANKNWN
jgi:N-acetylglucosamine kinase-like BadF-type ATPase